MNWLYTLKHCRRKRFNAFNWVAQPVSEIDNVELHQSHINRFDQISSITFVSLGSISDKIFLACDNKVKAFNKKGKIFLTFTSSLTEPIKSMYVSGNDMILCGNHVYNHYRDCKDIGSYLCGDTIVDAVAICPNNVNRSIFPQKFNKFVRVALITNNRYNFCVFSPVCCRRRE